MTGPAWRFYLGRLAAGLVIGLVMAFAIVFALT